jgi:hypothetical protein
MSPNGNQLLGAPNGGMDQTGSPSVDLPNGPNGLKVDVGETQSSCQDNLNLSFTLV